MTRKKPKIKFRHYLKEWRDFRGLTQEQAAERIERSKSTISRLEDGSVPYTRTNLEALAHAYRCEPSDLLKPPPDAQKTVTNELADYLMRLDQRDQARILRMVKAMAEEEDNKQTA